MKLISIVLPTYNEEKGIEKFYSELSKVLADLKNQYKFELLFINDGSEDNTLKLLSNLSQNDQRIKIINFDKNYGQQSATSAGLDLAKGEAIIIMDTDLQDPPSVIPQMIKFFEEGFDVVHGVRKGRKDNFFKNFTAEIFYKIYKLVSGFNAIENAADFKLISKDLQKKVNSNPSDKSYLRGAIGKHGKNQKILYYLRPARELGESKYTFSKMIKLALIGFVFALAPNKLKKPHYVIREIIQIN